MRRAALVAVFAAACGGAAPGGPGIAGGPIAPPRGSATGLSATGNIGPAGGSVSLVASDTGQLQLTVPAGAVSAAADFTIEEIAVSGLPGAVGVGYRVTGPALLAAATLSFTPAAPQDPATLTVAVQDGTGYWTRVYFATHDATAVSIQTGTLADYSLVTIATQLDLHGHFRLDSTQGLPFTAEGDVTLQYLADGVYMPQGDIALTATPCDAPPPADPLPASIAELISGKAFRWGINGDWKLSCGFISTNFDSLGITNLECARSYTAAMPVSFDPSHVSGQYLVDCGAGGTVTASWDLVPPDQTPGVLPAP